MNSSWAPALVDHLIAQGIELFCLSPGRRSTSLVLAVANHPKAKTFIHFDERGTAFHALGYAKATGKPAAVIITSGSAIGNLMPAVMEASAAHVPMLLLTADRPPELQNTMANQTCDQVKFFGDYVRHFFDLPLPDPSLPESYLAKTVSHAVQKTQFPYKGPVQLNCRFREPFTSEHPEKCNWGQGTQTTLGQLMLSETQAKRWAKKLETVQKGVILLGAHESSSHNGIRALAQTLSWPVLPDIISSYRSLADESTIPYFPYLLPNLEEKPDLILHFGNQFVSKALLEWMSNAGEVVHVESHPNRCDPVHCVTDRVFADPNLFCKAVLPYLSSRSSSYISQWKQGSKHVEAVLETLIGSKEILSEMGIFWTLKKHIPEDFALFIGNSMPIRDADTLLFPKTPGGPIFANRGLSGIDGNIGTCAGISQNTPLIAIVGDQTLLHDLNSLAQLTKTPHPVKMVVVNNQGGGIFSFFTPPSQDKLWAHFFNATHSLTFEKAAQFFSLPYKQVTHAGDLIKSLNEPGSSLIEIPTHTPDNVALHRRIHKEICSSFSTVS